MAANMNTQKQKICVNGFRIMFYISIRSLNIFISVLHRFSKKKKKKKKGREQLQK